MGSVPSRSLAKMPVEGMPRSSPALSTTWITDKRELSSTASRLLTLTDLSTVPILAGWLAIFSAFRSQSSERPLGLSDTP